MDKKALLLILKKNFPVQRYKPGSKLEDLAMSSGEQNVIDYIERLSTDDRLK